MAKLPKTILSDIRTNKYPSKEFTYRDFKKAFAMNSYGSKATAKWWDYFITNGIIVEVKNGQDIFTCSMW